jgi:IclR family transcriptional regulator, acetate operon repressor
VQIVHAASPPLQTVDRALQVLAQFRTRGQAFSVTELAAGLGLHRSTTSRLVSTLAARGFLERTAHDRVRLGPENVRLGRLALAGTELPALAQPIMQALAASTGEAVTLAVASDQRVRTVAEAHSHHFVASRNWVGVQTAAHCVADGKVLLAFGAIPAPQRPLERLTDRTIVELGALASELQRVRAAGFAVARGELEQGLHGVAVPVMEADTCVAALCVSGPEYRLAGAFERPLLPGCRAAAAEIEARLREARALGGGGSP